MERRVLLAIFLSFLVLYAYQAFLSPPGKKVPAPTAAPGAPRGAKAPSTGEAGPDPLALPAGDASVQRSAAPVLAESQEHDILVETDLVVATFTNRGAHLKSWRLKKYLDGQGAPLDLVETELGSNEPRPFALRTPDPATTSDLNAALYVVKGAPSQPGPQSAPIELTFEYQDDAGLQALKTFRVEPGAYTLSFRARVTRNGQPLMPEIVWGPGLGDQNSQTGRNAVKPGGIYSVAGKVSRLAAKAIATQPSYEQTFEYAGIDDHYFTSIALKPGSSKVTYQNLSIPPPEGSTDPVRDLVSYSLVPSSADQMVDFYVGPKDFDALAVVDRNLVRAINFGMFSVIVVPLLRSLNWIHGFVGNYGWAIVVLTALINLVLFPLNHKSVVSMRKMQEIQPETKAIQERYAKLKATDPARQKMNQELMALYRERGVNPASGCVPILLTLPVFLAFYSLLTTAIELRGAPFVGWIHDLSQSDPYYVMPVLVGISQIAMQWMTPQAGVDPTQQKMMLIMPVVLIFVFVSTPAGALIYWLVGNIWRMGQQQLTNYLIGPPNIRTMRPAAERRVKRVGSGKSEGASREN
jgi:YidC/Oxa1 family membrane protein insertase